MWKKKTKRILAWISAVALVMSAGVSQGFSTFGLGTPADPYSGTFNANNVDSSEGWDLSRDDSGKIGINASAGNGAYFAFKNLDFGTDNCLGTITINQVCGRGGVDRTSVSLEVRLDRVDGERVGELKTTPNPGVWGQNNAYDTVVEMTDAAVIGVHDLYFVLLDKDAAPDIYGISFEKGTAKYAYNKSFDARDIQQQSGWNLGPDEKIGLNGNAGNGSWFCFEELHFGGAGLSGIVLKQACDRGDPDSIYTNVAFNVYIDGKSESEGGTMIGEYRTVRSGWGTQVLVNVLMKDIAVTGAHDVYFVLQNKGVAPDLFGITFTEAPSAYGTYTGNDVQRDPAGNITYNSSADCLSLNGTFENSDTASQEGWFKFDKMNFGENGLSSIVLTEGGFRDSANADDVCFNIYIDGKSKAEGGTLIATFKPNPQDKTWGANSIVSAVLEEGVHVTGIHSVYFVLEHKINMPNIYSIAFNEIKSAYATFKAKDVVRDPAGNITYNSSVDCLSLNGSFENNAAASQEGWFNFGKMDFGKSGLGGIILSEGGFRGNANADDVCFNIYIDGKNEAEGGQKIATFKARPDAGTWSSGAPVSAVMEKGVNVTGVHSVYFVLEHKINMPNVFGITFEETKYAYSGKVFDSRNVNDQAGWNIDTDSGKIGVNENGGNGSWFKLGGLDFGNAKLGTITLNYACHRGGTPAPDYSKISMEIYVGGKSEAEGGQKIATFTTSDTGAWTTKKDKRAVLIDGVDVTGVQDVYFVLVNKETAPDIFGISFREAEPAKSAYGTEFLASESDEWNGLIDGVDRNDPTRPSLGWDNSSATAYFMLQDLDFGDEALRTITFKQAANWWDKESYGDKFIPVGEYYTNPAYEIRLDSLDGTKIGTLWGKRTGDWDNWNEVDAIMEKDVNVTGVHSVYFVAPCPKEECLVKVKSVQFKTGGGDDTKNVDDYLITVDSSFDGYNSVVDRPTTADQPAYNYSTHLMKMSDGTYRAYVGGRWRRATPGMGAGDGDHILRYDSATGAPYSWTMVGNGPVFNRGDEDGKPNQWFSNNVIEPEVMYIPDYDGGTWLMYAQVEITGDTPIDDGKGTTPGDGRWTDRIMLLTSKDGNTWTRYEERGVITNIVEDGKEVAIERGFHHQEVIYVPWDEDGKPYWMYVCVNKAEDNEHNEQMLGYYRIRSADPYEFDYTTRERTSGYSQLGNQLGYLTLKDGSHLFTRITFHNVNDRETPTLQFSTDGLNWSADSWILAPSDNEVDNKNFYFLGFTTINGAGEIPYNTETGKYEFLYAGTTCNSAVAPQIFKSQIGGGRVTLTVDENPVREHETFRLSSISTGFENDIIGLEMPVNMKVKALNSEGVAYQWKVSDESIATIDANGLLTPKKAGVVRVTLIADGQSKMCSVAIRKSTGTLYSESNTCLIGKTMQMLLNFDLDGVANPMRVFSAADVEWSIIKGNGATISADGLLTSNQNGEVTVQAILKNAPSKKYTKVIRLGDTYIKLYPAGAEDIDEIQITMRPIFVAEVISTKNDYELVWTALEQSVTFTDMTTDDMAANSFSMRLEFVESGKVTIRVAMKNDPTVYTDYVLNVTADKVELLTQLEIAKEYERGTCSEYRWNNLQKAIAHAEIIYADPAALQSEINKAVELLRIAIDELELPDKDGSILDDLKPGENPEAPDTGEKSYALLFVISIIAAASIMVALHRKQKKVSVR